jgi:hypothetical protein
VFINGYAGVAPYITCFQKMNSRAAHIFEAVMPMKNSAYAILMALANILRFVISSNANYASVRIFIDVWVLGRKSP